MYNYIKIKQLNQQNPKFWKYLRWIIIIVVTIALIFGIKSYVKSVYEKEMKKQNSEFQIIKDNFRESVKKSQKSSYYLTSLGIKMLKSNQTIWAAIILEEASAKDPKYRDAALYAGYANLRIAQEVQNENMENYSEKAIEYLNKAKIIDPVYSQTYEFLTIAYQNLGDNKNAELCYNKFKDFSKQ